MVVYDARCLEAVTPRPRGSVPEMRCQRKVVEDLTRRGKVLKARMVDGKLLWVREQSQKENP